MVHRSANIRKLAKDHGIKATDGSTAISDLVRDSSAVRWLFVRLAGAVGRQSALHKENSGFAAPTLGRHISTFRGYRILFSIQIPSPIIFLFIHYHLILRKWCYTQVQHDFHIHVDPIISPFQFLFQPFVTWLPENYDYCNVSWEMICIYDLTLSKMRRGERNTCSFRSPWVTLPLNVFFPTHFVLFPSALIWAVDGTVCPAEYALYRLPCDLYVVYVCK